MIVAVAPLVVAIVGLVLWFMASPSPKPWAELGRIVFFCGLLVLVASLVNVAWRFTLG